MCSQSNGWRRYVLPSNWATMTMFMLLMSLSTIGQEEIQLPHGFVKIYADETVADTYVAPPAEYVPGGERAANFNVTYTGFTTQAQTAFQYAVDLWAALITSSVTIEVNANFTSLAPNVLGSAGASTVHRDFSGAPEAGTWYPQALANSLAGSDLSGQPDINANFNSDFTWYYGLDGNTPAGQYDFVTVVLHELGHGLGFFGSAYVDGSLGYIRQDGYPYIYDLFVQTGGGTDILDYSDGTSALAGVLQGNNLFWNGFWGTAGNSGSMPPLYAPSSWDGGSSYSHLNESTFPSGNINSLMTPQLGSAEAIHAPGPATIGIFTDMGWSITGGCSSCSGSCVTLAMQDSFGDGWNGAEYTITNADGSVVASGTLSDGSAGSVTWCLSDGCYTIEVGGGTFDSEITWTLNGIDGGSLGGGAPESVAFSTGGVSCGGCTNAASCNYEPWAQFDDGSCCASQCVNLVMTDSFGDGWNGATYQITEYASGSIVASGTLNGYSLGYHNICLPSGCYYFSCGGGIFDSEIGWVLSGIDAGSINGGAPDSDIPFSVGSPICLGCSDAAACNYEPASNNNDGSCCYDNCVQLVMTDTFGDGWNGANYTIINENETVVASGTMSNGSLQIDELCLADGCYAITVGTGSFDSEIGWTLTGVDGGSVSGGAPTSVPFSINSVCGGCTDPEACNFSPVDQFNENCCYSNCYTLNVGGGFFDGEISWYISYNGFSTSYSGVGVSQVDLCLFNGCFAIEMYDSFGDGWNGATWELSDPDGIVVSSGTLSGGSYGVDQLISIGTTCIPGCRNPLACNFDSLATIDDGSCTYPGCTDSAACNWDPNAGCDSGSCSYDQACDVGHCVNTSGNGVDFTWAYSPSNWASITSGSNGVIHKQIGSFLIQGNDADFDADPNTQTYVQSYAQESGFYSFQWDYYTIDGPSYDMAYYINGVQFILTNSLGSNTQSGNTTFYANAGDIIGFGIESTDGGFGEGWVLISNFTYAPQTCGCTDNTACNFDPNADINDGSCCYTNCFTFNVGGGTFDSEISWEVYDDDNNLVYAGGAPYNEPFCLSNGCYNIIMYDSFGDSWNGASWTLSNSGGVVATGTHPTGSMSQSFLYGVNTTCVPGCTSPIACNYNSAATIDDSSCTYPGCTNATACNFDPNAGCDDGSCTFTEDDCSFVCTNTEGDAMGFVGVYDPFNWTFQTSPGNGWIEGSVGYMAIAGTNNDNSLDFGIISQASIVAQFGGEYSFTWSYATLDGPQYDFAYYINDVLYLLTSELGGGTQSGTITMNVNAGDIIGFGINATDGVFGRGYLLITDFTWPNVVCGCTDVNACNYNNQAIIDDGTCEYASCACPGDLNNDGMVDTLDLLLFLGAFGCTGTCVGDMDNSGAVNTTDLLIFLGLFGTNCSAAAQ